MIALTQDSLSELEGVVNVAILYLGISSHRKSIKCERDWPTDLVLFAMTWSGRVIIEGQIVLRSTWYLGRTRQ